MTVIQIIALLCLPFVWMWTANGPSRGAMRRMRRNARRGGVAEDVAYDRWLRKHGRGGSFARDLKRATTEEHVALSLVLGAAAEICESIERGEATSEAKARVEAERYPVWKEQCGSAIARQASEMLSRCGPAAFLVPGELIRTALGRS